MDLRPPQPDGDRWWESVSIDKQEPDVINHILRDFIEQCNITHHTHFILVIIILDIYILTFINGRRCWTSVV